MFTNATLLSSHFMWKMAGDAEMGKWKDDYKAGKRATPQVPSSWRPIVITGYYPSPLEELRNTAWDLLMVITRLTICGYEEGLSIIIQNTNKHILVASNVMNNVGCHTNCDYV